VPSPLTSEAGPPGLRNPRNLHELRTSGLRGPRAGPGSGAIRHSSSSVRSRRFQCRCGRSTHSTSPRWTGSRVRCAARAWRCTMSASATLPPLA